MSREDSIRYVVVRIHLDHNTNLDPDDIITEMDYNFKVSDSQAQDAEILQTEIVDICDERPA